tara:strand:+ start:13104 stop:13280 length:177 start_codon:yes stop_codon:yes gene_type:complete
MLFDVEHQSYPRIHIKPEDVCKGCAFFGNEHDEEPFCIMEEDPKKCRVAQALGKYDKK